jgi:PAS domain S-box-containing protein
MSASLKAAEPKDYGLELLTMTLDRARDAVAVVKGEGGDPGAEVVHANRAFLDLVGRSRPEVVGQSPYRFLSVEGDSGALDDAFASLRRGEQARLRLSQEHDGRRRWVEVELEPLPLTAPTPYWLVCVRDVTERERRLAQEFLLDRASTLGALSSGVAHEINNPLAFVRANVEFLHEAAQRFPDLADGEVAEVFDETLTGLDRVARIVRDLRLLTFQVGQDVMESTDVREALESALNLSGAMIRRKASLRVQIDDYVPPVVGNASQLVQLFANLVINAVDVLESPREDAVSVRLWYASPRVCVSVEDSGPGIADELRELVFEPFFTTKPLDAGVGMGLARCRRIVDAHGGAITLGESPLGGASFTVSLPAIRNLARTAEHVVAEVAPARVLVINDDIRIAQAVGRLLEHAYDVTPCGSAVEALELIDRGESFDAIITDVVMNPLMGTDFHAALVARGSDQAARVLFIVGTSLLPEHLAYLDESGCAILNRPLRKEILIRTLGDLVRPGVDGRPPPGAR